MAPMADTTRSWPRALALVAVAAVLGGAGLAACGDEGSGDDEVSEAPRPSAAEASEGFCREMARLGGERPEAYVGSDEHIADTEALLEVAPDDVRDDVELYLDFLRSGAITDDPASKDREGWPADVQAATRSIQDAQTETC